MAFGSNTAVPSLTTLTEYTPRGMLDGKTALTPVKLSRVVDVEANAWNGSNQGGYSNPDVAAIPRRHLLELFPEARAAIRKITLAPPIARAVCGVHPALYSVFNLCPLFRTHLLAWLEKPGPQGVG